MENIKTYPIGSGEITLTDFDAEELRIMLQTEYLREIVIEVVTDHKKDFNHLSPSQLKHLLDDMVSTNLDFINYDSSYFAENILENALRMAERYKPDK